MNEFDPTEFAAAVNVSGQGSRRRYLVYDISKSDVSGLIAALSTADKEADYVDMSHWERLASEPHMRTTIILCVGTSIIDFRETLFSEFDKLKAEFPGVTIICITDEDNPGFLRSCYSRGIRQVLPASLALNVTITILQLISTGGTFIPSHLLT